MLKLLNTNPIYQVVVKPDVVSVVASKRGTLSFMIYGFAAWFLYDAVCDILENPNKAIISVGMIIIAALTAYAGTIGVIDKVDFKIRDKEIVVRKGMIGGFLPSNDKPPAKYPFSIIKQIRIGDFGDPKNYGASKAFVVDLILDGKGLNKKAAEKDAPTFIKNLVAEGKMTDADLQQVIENHESAVVVTLFSQGSAQDAFKIISKLDQRLNLGWADQFRSQVAQIRSGGKPS